MTESTNRDPDVPLAQPPSYQASASSTPGATGTNVQNHSRVAAATRSADTQKPQLDTTSDKSTAAFIRRTLCSHNVLLGNGEKGRSTPRPIEDVLPPLTSSNEVDLQLYGIISVIIKEFVQTWYSKITPDQVFVNEVIQIIAHCTRGLEQRLRKVDLESLLLDEIPELLQAHLTSFRIAKTQAASSISLVSDPRLIYHTLHPHPALSPVPTDDAPATVLEQRESESAWRQLLIHGVLALLLPTEDLKNGCLRALVGEIFAEMILGNGISGKACEGWVLWEGITRIAEVLQTDAAKEKDSQSDDADAEQSLTRLERYGLLSTHQGVGETNGVLDRFLAHAFHTQILNPAFLPVALRTLRATLFPNNALGPPRQIPTYEEIKEIKRCCAARLLDLVPPKVAAAFFASYERDEQVRQIANTLDCLDDAYLNKHLVFQIVELIVLRLFPELGEQGVNDLLEERIS
ncbi:uncharacterized protein J4E78_002849 [Alternaria triticimaculans]|uniref:uncharacterized protein n=1 Tax=Alternaria triticimaculans TaxID=297637 RepID=UPI0020C20CE5|nr:uncharacterized protein J4E78_002849 [Alternaria triticimaculans]KAI4665389.1 hypothetical protein J4E78_002849 [Alternaria triticimaculans]